MTGFSYGRCPFTQKKRTAVFFSLAGVLFFLAFQGLRGGAKIADVDFRIGHAKKLGTGLDNCWSNIFSISSKIEF